MRDCEDATAHQAKTVTLNLVTVTIEIPEDRDARFQRQGQARGLTVDRWLLELAEQNAPALPGAAPPKRTFAPEPAEHLSAGQQHLSVLRQKVPNVGAVAGSCDPAFPRWRELVDEPRMRLHQLQLPQGRQDAGRSRNAPDPRPAEDCGPGAAHSSPAPVLGALRVRGVLERGTEVNLAGGRFW